MSRPQFTPSISETDYIAVPLRALDRSIKAWTLIDLDDVWALGKYRWFENPSGYVARSKTSNHVVTAVFLAREILGLPRKSDGRQADHRNRNRLDNRRSNLRILTSNQNKQNKSSYKGHSSQYRGVSFAADRRKWRAVVTVDGKNTRLGQFDNEEDAAQAAREARQRLMPYAID